MPAQPRPSPPPPPAPPLPPHPPTHRRSAVQLPFQTIAHATAGPWSTDAPEKAGTAVTQGLDRADLAREPPWTWLTWQVPMSPHPWQFQLYAFSRPQVMCFNTVA